MKRLEFYIAGRQLLDRKRQSIVSLLGIVFGVAFFLAISSLMQGSEKDFIRRLIDNAPHITVYDEYRSPRQQPLSRVFPQGALELRHTKPLTETRGLRNYHRILDYLRNMLGVEASAILVGQALVSFTGKDWAVTLNGIVPAEYINITTISDYMLEGALEDLNVHPDGVVIGSGIAETLSITVGDNLTLAATTGQLRTVKILGIFQTGRSSFDDTQVFVPLKRAQSLLDRVHRVNRILVRLPNAYQAVEVARQIEQRSRYKSISWQEASEDLMNTLSIRNTIMYTVVGALLLVAAFGIYNVISTVVMEKYRDIAILKSLGFYAKDIRRIFLLQGLILALGGCLTGIPFGMLLMLLLGRVEFTPPGASETITLPIDWSWPQFALGAAFAIGAALLAALLPARRAASVHPVDILRGRAG